MRHGNSAEVKFARIVQAIVLAGRRQPGDFRPYGTATGRFPAGACNQFDPPEMLLEYSELAKTVHDGRARFQRCPAGTVTGRFPPGWLNKLAT